MGSAQPIGTDSAQARLQHSSLLGFGRLDMQRSPLMETLQIRPRASFATHQRSPVSTSLRSLIAGRAAVTAMMNLASVVPCAQAFPALLTPAAGFHTHCRVHTHAAASKSGLACRVARSGGGGARWLPVSCAAGGGAG